MFCEQSQLMSKSNLFQKLSSVGLASTISILTIIGTILTPGIESMAQAATYIGEIGAGNLIPGLVQSQFRLSTQLKGFSEKEVLSRKNLLESKVLNLPHVPALQSNLR
jgi:hypothetical protein